MVLRGWRLILITETCLENSLHIYVYISMTYTSAISFLNNTDNQNESESEIAQSCPTLCDPIKCSLPGSSIHGIFQARVLEWVAISFSRGSSRPRDRTQVSHVAGRQFNIWVTWEALLITKIKHKYYLPWKTCPYFPVQSLSFSLLSLTALWYLV